MEQKLKGKRVAILVTHGFEQVELTEPRKALQAAGATAHVVSPVEGRVKGRNFTQWGDEAVQRETSHGAVTSTKIVPVSSRSKGFPLANNPSGCLKSLNWPPATSYR